MTTQRIKPIYPPSLRAMTLHFPWAWLIATGWKEEEFRSKPVSYRGYFLVHAGQSKASDYIIQEVGIPRDHIVRGAIIGAAEIVASYEDSEGATHKLDNAIAFEAPIGPVSG